jgi:hypothetical protein
MASDPPRCTAQVEVREFRGIKWEGVLSHLQRLSQMLLFRHPHVDKLSGIAA